MSRVTCHVWQVDRERQLIVEDFRLEECDAEEVAGELPTHQPRFLVSRQDENIFINVRDKICLQVYSFRHSHVDGRVSYPMVFVFVTPPGDKRD